MVVIRLSRGGAKKAPFYHIVAAAKRSARDGKYIERLGYYNPLAVGEAKELELSRDKIAEWISKGAQVSDKVKALLKQWDKQAA